MCGCRSELICVMHLSCAVYVCVGGCVWYTSELTHGGYVCGERRRRGKGVEGRFCR